MKEYAPHKKLDKKLLGGISHLWHSLCYYRHSIFFNSCVRALKCVRARTLLQTSAEVCTNYG